MSLSGLGPWPVVALAVALLAAVTVLGVTHVVDGATIAAVLQALVGGVLSTGGYHLGSSSAARAFAAASQAPDTAPTPTKETTT